MMTFFDPSQRIIRYDIPLGTIHPPSARQETEEQLNKSLRKLQKETPVDTVDFGRRPFSAGQDPHVFNIVATQASANMVETHLNNTGLLKHLQQWGLEIRKTFIQNNPKED
jgi:hypothetical protein